MVGKSPRIASGPIPGVVPRPKRGAGRIARRSQCRRVFIRGAGSLHVSNIITISPHADSGGEWDGGAEATTPKMESIRTPHRLWDAARARGIEEPMKGAWMGP
jgi:hypothetical protein